MISLSSIWAVTLRNLRVVQRDINQALGIFYWPLLDIFTWGFLGAWIAQAQVAALPHYETVALMGIILWQIVGRGCNVIIFAFAEELWSNNIVNIFSLPLRISEWIGGMLIFYGIMMGLSSFFCMAAMFMLYNLSIWNVISTFFLFLPPLVFCAIWIGFTCLQIIVTLGKRGVEVGFVFAWFLLPFSGAYYPIEILPKWAQMVSAYLPMSYVFQGMRGYVMYQQDPTACLIKGYVLSIIYAIIAVVMFVYFFNRSKQKGLARLTD